MRRILCILCLLLLVPACLAAAAETTLELSGPELLYAKEQFSLALTGPTEGLTQLTFTLTYDAENLSFLGLEADESSGWECTALANRFTLTWRSGGTRELPKLRFKLKNVPENTQFWVVLQDAVAVYDGQEQNLGALRWEKTVDQQVRTDNYLASLQISHGVLSPAFSPAVENYTVTVPYSVAAVDIAAAAQDPYAKIEINNSELTPNSVTQISITVTAQNGVSRVYTLAVTREEDPNRPVSTESRLADIVVRGFLLSPEFRPELTEYVLWLPYEVTSVDIGGIPKDTRATVAVEGNQRLQPGKDNPITLTCTAEDGTKTVYRVIAKRAPASTTPPALPTEPEQTVSTLAPTQPKPTESATVPTEPSPTAAATQPQQTVPATGTTRPEPTDTTDKPQPPSESEGAVPTETAMQPPQTQYDPQIPSWTYVVIAVAAISGCSALGILLSDRKK